MTETNAISTESHTQDTVSTLLRQRRVPGADNTAINSAIESANLTDKEALVIACIDGVHAEYFHVSRTLGIRISELKRIRRSACGKIAAAMSA